MPADAALIVPGSRTDLLCVVCASRVIAPSGQRFLQENSGVEIVCANCAIKAIEAGDGEIRGAGAPLKELAAEARAAVPNPRGGRQN